MKSAVISLGSKSSVMVIDAMKKYFDSVDNINLKNVEVNLSGGKPEVLYEGKPIEKYDCVYLKGSFRYVPLLRSIATALHGITIMPITPEAFTVGHDKLLTQLVIQQHKIPMPKTYLASTTEAAKKILKKVNYPIIMKFPHGTGGKGVMFADSFASASSLLDALEALRQPFIIQEYGKVKLNNSEFIEIAPDTHITKCSIRLGVITEKEAETLSKEEISEKWRVILKDTKIKPIEMHPPLWFWSRNNFKFKLF